jgi:hypothetical protein
MPVLTLGSRKRRSGALTLSLASGVVVAVLIIGAISQLPAVDRLGADPSTVASPSPSEAPVLDGDGIPVALDGRPVLRGPEVAAAVTSAVDDRPFLVAGWLMKVTGDCYAPDVRTELENPCANWFLRTKPTSDVSPSDVHRIVLTGLPALPRTAGPVVLEAHVYDLETELCSPETVERCQLRLVADAVVWP